MGGCIRSSDCRAVSRRTGGVSWDRYNMEGAYFGFLHATAITGLEDMFALDSEDALVALVFSSGPMFQLGQRCHGGKVVNAMREALRAKFWLPGHGYHVGDHGEIWREIK